MKKLLIPLLVGLSCRLGYADSKISAFGSTTTLNATDIIPVVTNPSTSAANKIIAKSDLALTLDVLTTSSATANFLSQSSATATYLQGSSATATYLQLSSATATYLQGSSATATYLQLSSATATYLQSSSATATYLQSSSATATYLQQSSATATYLQGSSATITYGQLASTQTWMGGNTFTSSVTFNNSSVAGGNAIFTSSITISTGIGSAAPAPTATSGFIRLSQGIGSGRAISFFRPDTGASLGYISNVLNSQFVLDNEMNSNMLFNTNGTTRLTIAAGGSVNINNSLTVNSSATITGPITSPYIISFSTTPLILATTSYQIAVTTSGIFSVGPSTSPVLSSCGTAPTIVGTNAAFTITPGATAGGCTATFVPPLKNTPTCLVSEQTMSVVNALTYTVTNTALTITQTSLSSKLDVHCFGQNE